MSKSDTPNLERERLLKEAKELTTSDNPLHHLIWVIEGIGVHQRSGGKRGHSVEQAKKYALAQAIEAITQHTDRAVEKVNRRTLETLASILHGTGGAGKVTHDRVVASALGYIDNKLKMYEAHIKSNGGDEDDR